MCLNNISGHDEVKFAIFLKNEVFAAGLLGKEA
jgi:hypothetical protein